VIAPRAVLTGRHGQYEILAEHARGGFGVTYRGRRAQGGDDVMLKVLRLDRMAGWKAHELFEREATVLRALDHPAIPGWIDDFVLGVADAPEAFVLVQEFIAGETLRQVMKGGRLAPEKLRRCFEQMLGVLEYLHDRAPPVIHRDVTPKNIILRPDGRVSLVDFGSVQAALRSADTVSSTAAGTFGYAPLEQFVGRAGPASDLYGLGMTYLAVATGCEPTQMPMDGVCVDVRALLGAEEPLVPLLESMTAADARQRPASAARASAMLVAATGRGPAEAGQAAGPPPARVADLEGYMALLGQRLQREGFSVLHGGYLGETALLLSAARPRGARHTASCQVFVARGEDVCKAGGTELPAHAMRAFASTAAAAAPRPRFWQGRATVIPLLVFGAGGAPKATGVVTARAARVSVLPAAVDLGAGEVMIRADPAGLGPEAHQLVAYAWWLATPRLAERPAGTVRSSLLRVAVGAAAGVVLLLAGLFGAAISMPTGRFFLTYATDARAGRIALKAHYGRSFFFATDVLTLAPPSVEIRRGRLPADALLCELSGDRLGYWRRLDSHDDRDGAEMLGYFRAGLDGAGEEELARGPAPRRWTCAIQGDSIVYPVGSYGAGSNALWLKRGKAAVAQPVPGARPGDTDPAWFPDGRALIVAHAEGAGPARLYRLDLADGRRTLLPEGPPASGAQLRPTVSPDGTQVAFYRAVRRSFDEVESRGTGEVHDLELLDLGRGQSRLLLQDVCFTVAPAWLQNDTLVFGKWVGDRCGLYRFDLRTEETRLLARDY
jgi:hypothetical protein